MRLEGKIALVAGSGRGTGRAIALELATEGADVITNALTPENAQGVAEEIRKLGRESIALPCDLSDRAQAREMVHKALQEFGRIDILVYNAAVESLNPFLETSEQAWDKAWDEKLNTNLRGYFVCAHAVACDMADKEIKGKIIGISSVAGLLGFPNVAEYCAAKAGMLGLTKGMAIDLGRSGITANCVCPGVIESEALTDGPMQEVANAWKKLIPLRKLAQPRDIARAVVFLASSDADHITGTEIIVDGGEILNNKTQTIFDFDED